MAFTSVEPNLGYIRSHENWPLTKADEHIRATKVKWELLLILPVDERTFIEQKWNRDQLTTKGAANNAGTFGGSVSSHLWDRGHCTSDHGGRWRFRLWDHCKIYGHRIVLLTILLAHWGIESGSLRWAFFFFAIIRRNLGKKTLVKTLVKTTHQLSSKPLFLLIFWKLERAMRHFPKSLKTP